MREELLKQLKEKGFPVKCKLPGHDHGKFWFCGKEDVPTLSELIEACNPHKADEFYLNTEKGEWRAFYRYYGYFDHNEKFRKEDGMFEVEPEAFGGTPEEAVAKLWLSLQAFPSHIRE